MEERNRKISHLIESVIRDYDRIYNTVAEANDGGIIVYYNDEPLYYLGIEFNESDYDICFNGFVFSNLPMSEVTLLREIYKDDDLTEFLANNSMELWFFEDDHLMTRHVSAKEYKDYSILKTAFAIELSGQINNTVKVIDHLAKLIEEREGVLVN